MQHLDGMVRHKGFREAAGVGGCHLFAGCQALPGIIRIQPPSAHPSSLSALERLKTKLTAVSMA